MWVLLLASQWPDWLQLFFTALGADNAQLYSHSIPAIVTGAILFTSLFLWRTGNVNAAPLVMMVYLTHPVLDLVTGMKPLWPGGPNIGANWYDHPARDFLLEGALLCVAWSVYRSTLGTRRSGLLPWVMLAALIGCQLLLDAGQELRLRRRVPNGEMTSVRCMPDAASPASVVVARVHHPEAGSLILA